MNSEVDYKQISPELREKLAGWESNTRSSRQVELLEKIASKPNQVVVLLGDGKKTAEQTTADLTGLLTDIRDSLDELNDKENPEAPDYAGPIVSAVGSLEGALRQALSRPTPQVKVNTPQVNVDVPEIDLRGVEQLLKTDIPEAFKQAIKMIPKVNIPENDYSSLLGVLERMSEQLESIDTASRLKVQGPGGSSSGGSTISIIGSSSSVVIPVGDSTTSAQLIAANANRREVEFVNTSSATLYLLKGPGIASSTNYTVDLEIGDYYSSDSRTSFSGVWASDAGGSVNITESI